MLAEFRQVVSALTFRPPELPIISTVTGAPATVEQLTSPEYWCEQVRRPVRFADGIGALADAGVTELVELGPDDTLAALARDCLAGKETGDGASVVSLLHADTDEHRAVLSALGALHCRGVAMDWTTLFPGAGRVDLPTYAFQRRHYWLRPPEGTAPAGRESVVRSWRYHEAWPPCAASLDGVPVGRWLLLAGAQGETGNRWLSAVATALTQRGAEVEWASPDRAAGHQDLAGVLIVPDGPGDLARLARIEDERSTVDRHPMRGVRCGR